MYLFLLSSFDRLKSPLEQTFVIKRSVYFKTYRKEDTVLLLDKGPLVLEDLVEVGVGLE